MGNALLSGADFGSSLYAGALSGMTAAASGAVIGGISGGISSKEAGLDFWNGTPLQKEINLPELIVFSEGKSIFDGPYSHHEGSRFQVAQKIMRTSWDSPKGYNFASDFTRSQQAWFSINGGLYNSLNDPGTNGFFTLGLSASFAGGMGASISGGVVLDFRNGFNWGLYGSAGPSFGIDAAIGVNAAYNVADYTSSFSMQDISGLGINQSIGIGPVSLSNSSSSVYNSYGIGIAPYSARAGYTYNRLYTRIFTP